jgi:hypothetical protein
MPHDALAASSPPDMRSHHHLPALAMCSHPWVICSLISILFCSDSILASYN